MNLIDLAKRAGMDTSLAHMGAASLVTSEGCQGVTIAALESFAALVIHDHLRAQACAQMLPPDAKQSREQSIAFLEAYLIVAEDAYFAARPNIDTAANRRLFAAGFARGWDNLTQ